jgi:hypothetical protein
MKKYFILAAVMLFAVAATAQTYTLLSPYGNATDSVSNSATNYLYKQIPGPAEVITIQLTITKLSGTGAGTATLWASLDGVTYVRLRETGYHSTTTSTNSDSLAIKNVTTQSIAWSVKPSTYLYYKVSVTGSGTELLTLAATAIQRKPK